MCLFGVNKKTPEVMKLLTQIEAIVEFNRKEGKTDEEIVEAVYREKYTIMRLFDSHIDFTSFIQVHPSKIKMKWFN